ncbi:terpenoid synthase [Laetiporus sulphureus 93-53]|uniref:Terpene synthase n=1 Tax=Laetiporus sulphureus 93-53 TaxID=1314785 RepID=A0A165ERG7_9APHY|nr:terpenoid synthase [Laetiporus sulphureus 93-53]KZT07613.1 terpenoid synthase [Laetiporus sulphureus 93-53]
MSDCKQEIITFPDLMKSIPFPIRLNPYTRFVSADSDAFILEYGNFSEKQRAKFIGLNAGLLCGMCYAESGPDELRVCSDFMSFLFNLDDWSDEFDTTGTKGLEEAVMNTLRHPDTFHSDTIAARTAKSWWTRMLKTVGPNCKERFIYTMGLYFKAIMQQAADRASNSIPELEAYIDLRRSTSGCKTGFALIEYAAGIDLPNEVYEHPAIQGLLNATNDCVSWANDILSYNREQSRGDSHNLVPVLMRTLGIERQAAVDYAADLCNKTVERFLAGKTALPSWGPEVDAQVQQYIQGLEDWIIANAEWSFMTERYFGKDGPKIRKSLQVPLLPVVGFV